METRVPLTSLMHVLPAEMAGQIKEIVGDTDGATVHRKSVVDAKAKPLDPGEREVLQYVSTRDIDREKEILDPDGCILTEFRKAPQVLWGHDYSRPPIGSDRVIEKDGYGIRAITRYARTDMGNDIWLLRRDGHLNTSSVGFVPMTTTRKGEGGWSKLTEKLATKWQVAPTLFEKADSIVSQWLLLEHSDVSVPANIHARTIAVGPDAEGKAIEELLASGAIKTKAVCESLAKTIKEWRAAAEAEGTEPCEPVEIEVEVEVEPERESRRVLVRMVEPPRVVRVVQRIDAKAIERNTRTCIRHIRGELE